MKQPLFNCIILNSQIVFYLCASFTKKSPNIILTSLGNIRIQSNAFVYWNTYFKLESYKQIFWYTLVGEVHYVVASHLPACSSNRNDNTPPPMTFFFMVTNVRKTHQFFALFAHQQQFIQYFVLECLMTDSCFSSLIILQGYEGSLLKVTSKNGKTSSVSLSTS